MTFNRPLPVAKEANLVGGDINTEAVAGIKPREQETEPRGGSQQFGDSAESSPLCETSVSRQPPATIRDFEGRFRGILHFAPRHAAFFSFISLFFSLSLSLLFLLFPPIHLCAVERDGNGFVRVSFFLLFLFFLFSRGRAFASCLNMGEK